jgi:hypothetical protein
MPGRSSGLLDGCVMMGQPQVAEELCLHEVQGVSIAMLGVSERPPKAEHPDSAEWPHDDRERIELAATAEEVKDRRR